jgi:hypothetical protein
MHFNCYCPDGYHGYLNNGTPTLPPLGQFSKLPWELQLEIIKQAIGPDLPQSFAQMELISSQWRDFVLSVLWPAFVQSQFPKDKIAEANQTLITFGKQPSWKNIYRLLTSKFVETKFLIPGMFGTPLIRPEKPFFWRATNIGKYKVRALFSGNFEDFSKTLETKELNPVHYPHQKYLSPLYPIPSGIYKGGRYLLGLTCEDLTTECQATGEIRELDI